MKKIIHPRNVISLCALLAGTTALADGSDPLSSWKPTWLTDASITFKEGYDNNVYMSDVSQAVVPAGTVTLKDRNSFFTTVSPKIGFDFARAFNTNSGLQTLSFVYAPDFNRYEALPAENYDAHRMNLLVKGATGDFSYLLDNSLVYNDASSVAPAYPGSLYNAWGPIFDYWRREAAIDRAKVALQYDLGSWFLRPTASLAYFGMMTQLKNPDVATTPSGYLNYAPRYDVNGGMDVGYRLNSQLAATIGYRYGHNEQEQFSFSPYSSTSDYQRVLLGLEGKPLKWLEVQLQGGPDFRDYMADSATHITPINDLHRMTYYGDATVTATLSAKDSLYAKYKGFQFVSCLGKTPYFDSSYILGYRRKITGSLSLDVGAKLLEADYTMGNLEACHRRDLDYVMTAGLHYVFNPHLSADLAYEADMGRNDEPGITDSAARSFDAQIISLAVQFGF